MTLDPTSSTPAIAHQSLFSSFSQLVDSLRMRWYRHVINFSFSDQYHLLTALKRPHRWFGSGFRGLSVGELRKRFFTNLGWWMGMGFLLGILAIGWNRLRGKKIGRKAYSPGASQQATERYRRFLALLGKRGFRKKPAETPDEFSQRTKIEGNGLVKEFTALYQQARFSGLMDSIEGLKKLDQILIQLGK
ncbi:MAG: DUF4129 domain-containing protein [Candidatus Binatia bacterium]